MLSIFISSPANEFKEERIKIKKFIEEKYKGAVVPAFE